MIAARMRHAEWVKERLAGARITDIADKYGVSKAAVSQAIKNLMLELPTEDAEQLRIIETDRLEEVHAVSVRIMCGSSREETQLKAADRVIRASQRRSELLGLNRAPQAAVGPDGKPVVPQINVLYVDTPPQSDQ